MLYKWLITKSQPLWLLEHNPDCSLLEQLYITAGEQGFGPEARVHCGQITWKHNLRLATITRQGQPGGHCPWQLPLQPRSNRNQRLCFVFPVLRAVAL